MEATEPTFVDGPIPGLLALPPSDPTLYEQNKRGVVKINPMTIPRAPKEEEEKKEKKSKTSKKNKKKGKRGKQTESDDEYDDSEEQKMMKDKFHDEWEKKRKQVSKKDLETNTLLVDDHYHVLGLEDFGLAATEHNIKSAYRKLALEYHPDKKRPATEEEKKDEGEGDTLNPEEKVKKEIWLKILKAYETLIDPEKRKKYDSSLPFDENIPDEDDFDDESFYDVFTEVFNRNAIWAKNKPVPQLGNEKTPIKKVLKFYRYWDNFDTWRDFSCHDEYDLEEAGDRYERAYMNKENKKIRDKYIKVEKQRLIELYRIAYNNDPRIKAHNEQLKKEEEQKKKEKFEKKQKAREERKRLENEANRKLEEEKRKVEEAKEKQRKMVEIKKQLRETMSTKLIELADQKLKQFSYEYDQYAMEEIVKKLTDEDIQKLVNEITDMGEGQDEFDRVKVIIDQVKQDNIKRIKEEQKKDLKKREEAKESNKTWTKEDFALLVKALNKYPGGTRDRWKTIA